MQYVDYFYPEIEWSIIDPTDSTVVFADPKRALAARYSVVNANVPGLCRGYQYAFRITSTVDGFGGDHGYYMVKSDGVFVLANFAFTGSEDTYYFTLTESPTDNPTASPTVSPILCVHCRVVPPTSGQTPLRALRTWRHLQGVMQHQY